MPTLLLCRRCYRSYFSVPELVAAVIVAITLGITITGITPVGDAIAPVLVAVIIVEIGNIAVVIPYLVDCLYHC